MFLNKSHFCTCSAVYIWYFFESTNPIVLPALSIFWSYTCVTLKNAWCLHYLQWLCLFSDLIFTHCLSVCLCVISDQPPRLISMQQLPRGPGGMNGGPGPPMYPSSHHMRLPGPPQGRMPTAQPRHNGQQYSSMMQPQLQRQVSTNTHWVGNIWTDAIVVLDRISHVIFFFFFCFAFCVCV